VEGLASAVYVCLGVLDHRQPAYESTTLHRVAGLLPRAHDGGGLLHVVSDGLIVSYLHASFASFSPRRAVSTTIRRARYSLSEQAPYHSIALMHRREMS
jgi:hypothetical protein